MADVEITEQTTLVTVVEDSTAVEVNESEQVVITEVGIPGPPGPPGDAGLDAFYTHDQLVASATWTINHSLGKYPSITIVDSGGNVVVGDITYNDLNTAVAHFSAIFGGQAFCN